MEGSTFLLSSFSSLKEEIRDDFQDSLEKKINIWHAFLKKKKQENNTKYTKI